MAYLLPDERRDAEAMQLVKHKQISTPDPQPSGFAFTCYSSIATEYNKAAIPYHIFIGRAGNSKCNCLDFQGRGGACKHIRAALVSLNELRHQGYSIPPIRIPTSVDEARSLQRQQLSNFLSPALDNSNDITNPIQTAAVAVENALLTDIAFAAHTTTADEIDGGEKSDNGESDGESVATDVGDEFDFTVLRGGSTAQEALDVQKTARVFFELDQAAPKLEQLVTILEGARMNRSDLSRAAGFVEQLGRLKTELIRMVEDAESDKPATTTPATNETSVRSWDLRPRRLPNDTSHMGYTDISYPRIICIIIRSSVILKVHRLHATPQILTYTHTPCIPPHHLYHQHLDSGTAVLSRKSVSSRGKEH
jgi:hypothetical protein